MNELLFDDLGSLELGRDAGADVLRQCNRVHRDLAGDGRAVLVSQPLGDGVDLGNLERGIVVFVDGCSATDQLGGMREMWAHGGHKKGAGKDDWRYRSDAHSV